MLNSRYAPIVMLTVLGIIAIGLLAWFLAIKPQFDKASDLRAQTDAVVANTSQIDAQSAKLDEYAALLAEDSEIETSIALNAPSAVDVNGLRDRVWSALKTSKAELVSIEQQQSSTVDGWLADPSGLVSTQVAALFSTGPVGATATEAASTTEAPDPTATQEATTTTTTTGWTPAVTAVVTDGPFAGDIRMVPFTIDLVGNPEQIRKFIDSVQDPKDPLFQIYEYTLLARPAGDAPIPGVHDPDDGDVHATITGALYVLNPDLTVVDEEKLTNSAPKEQAFSEKSEAKEQPAS
ncbi:hypothetical protein [Demequina silvatica]|uniref:hypothetical protein n=1 Tax=Demequina silvatica TaxID=1638988 RepID=UPI000781DDD5|nr:hypothetical protein [Demequina silvatica]